MDYKKEAHSLISNKHLAEWVAEMAEMCAPDKIVLIDGSKEQKQALEKEAFSTGELILLNQQKLPGCVLHRSARNDVARTEHLTFISTEKKEDAGFTNNWMSPKETYEKLGAIYRDSMKGRTMYIIPFSMFITASPFRKIGVEITDSIYVALSMLIMTRAGKQALDSLGDSADFTKCMHGKEKLDDNRRFITHIPQDNAIWSVGSGYGGNALLGKKCLSLRIASFLAKKEGWMAEHMLIMGVKAPGGKTHYLTGAFPSQCGKTNLAMLVPPASMNGREVFTVGDDIAWMRVEGDGWLHAVNPEAGFFGVVPGTNWKTNPNAMKTIQKNTIYTNVLLKEDNTLWWEGLDGMPEKGLDWKGDPWTPSTGEKAAHPNSRFTAPVSQCPSLSPDWENPKGVPISAFLFGGRRAHLAPLVYESFNWQHGVFIGATMASETTAAATGKVGVVRRDPMAMLPFCGYNIGDYFAHWLKMGKKTTHPPKIFHVNWFRTNAEGKFLWPGFGENLRVLEWIAQRCEGKGEAVKTPIGFVPAPGAINTDGLDVSQETMQELLSVDKNAWLEELKQQEEFFAKFDRLPKEIREEHETLKERLGA
ncbi:MAG: phosphoenolpyruvate carboxykinase (GTP) [Candidatus Diapherotrites archaeon]